MEEKTFFVHAFRMCFALLAARSALPGHIPARAPTPDLDAARKRKRTARRGTRPRRPDVGARLTDARSCRAIVYKPCGIRRSLSLSRGPSHTTRSLAYLCLHGPACCTRSHSYRPRASPQLDLLRRVVGGASAISPLAQTCRVWCPLATAPPNPFPRPHVTHTALCGAMRSASTLGAHNAAAIPERPAARAPAARFHVRRGGGGRRRPSPCVATPRSPSAPSYL